MAAAVPVGSSGAVAVSRGQVTCSSPSIRRTPTPHCTGRAWLARAAPGRDLSHAKLLMTSAGRRWPLGPVAMDFLERLRVVGPAFVVFDLNVADAPLPPLTGYSDHVQDVGNPRPEGRFPGNACEHEGGAFMHNAKHIGAGNAPQRPAKARGMPVNNPPRAPYGL